MTTPNGTTPAPNGRPPSGEARGSDAPSPFDHAPPAGLAQTVSQVLGEIVWLMSASVILSALPLRYLSAFLTLPLRYLSAVHSAVLHLGSGMARREGDKIRGN